VGKATLTAAQREALLAGNFYSNLQSAAFPNGNSGTRVLVR
jgi:hypothetical protein